MRVFERVARLAAEGRSPREIAGELDLSRASVYAALRYARAQHGMDIPKFKTGRPSGSDGSQRVTIDAETAERLDALAGAFGLTGRELGARILSRVAPHGRVVAVLLKEEKT